VVARAHTPGRRQYAERRIACGMLPLRIGAWSPTSLQQRLVKTGGRLIKHAHYYWLLLAESHLTRAGSLEACCGGSRCCRYRQDSRPRWWLPNWLRGDGGMERVSLEMGRKGSGSGFRRGRSDGTGRFRGPASAKTKETPRPLVLRAALDYWHPYPRWENGNSG